MAEPLDLGPPPPIHIPTAGAAASAPAPAPAPAGYTVQSGDTLGRIAERNGTTVSDILKANPNIKNANQISVGQQLAMPAKQSAGGGFSTPPSPPPNRPPATSPAAPPPGQTPAKTDSS